MTGAMTQEEKNYIVEHNHRCPVCKEGMLLEGPHIIHVICDNSDCGARYKMQMVKGEILSGKRLSSIPAAGLEPAEPPVVDIPTCTVAARQCSHDDTENHRTYTWCKICGALWNTQRAPSIGWQLPENREVSRGEKG